MANQNDIFHRNVPGRFYVDNTCIDCGQCPANAPEFFVRDDEEGMSYVHRQPATAAELELTIEVMEGCPTESIGDDGVPRAIVDEQEVAER